MILGLNANFLSIWALMSLPELIKDYEASMRRPLVLTSPLCACIELSFFVNWKACHCLINIRLLSSIYSKKNPGTGLSETGSIALWIPAAAGSVLPSAGHVHPEGKLFLRYKFYFKTSLSVLRCRFWSGPHLFFPRIRIYISQTLTIMHTSYIKKVYVLLFKNHKKLTNIENSPIKKSHYFLSKKKE